MSGYASANPAYATILKEEFLEPFSITQGELENAMDAGQKTVREAEYLPEICFYAIDLTTG